VFCALIVLLIALVAPVKTSSAADYTETFDSGTAQGWTAAVGAWAVDGGTYHGTAIGPADITVYGGGSWSTDFIYHAKINNGFNNTGNLAGAAYNYQDANNYYAVIFAALGGTAYLIKVINGTMTIVATAPYSGGGQKVWFDVDVIRIGTGTTVKVNGTPVFDNVTQNELGAGKIGLITYWADARFDNISLTAGIRDPLKWPFAGSSIWNVPIGSNAVYVPANIPPNPSVTDLNDPNYWLAMPQIDWDIIVLTPNAPITDINYSSAGWSEVSRCSATADPRNPLFQLPMPSTFFVESTLNNNSSAFLKPDGRTLIQTQPFARCAPPDGDGTATTLTDRNQFPPVDLYGDGIRGSHGGSGLSAIGGSVRLGELRRLSQGPRHALKLGVYSGRDLYKCTTPDDSPTTGCYRWPAVNADFGAERFYGRVSNNNNAAMKMGALLAIPASVNLATMGLETDPARQLAWTLQNYGAYIDDSGTAPAFMFDAEKGPDGALDSQFEADWGFPLEERWRTDATRTPWARDMQRLMTALYVVDNNSSTSIGGGGTPRQPLAPPLSVTRSEESAATKTGSWSPYGSGTGDFSGGVMVASNVAGSTATFSFTGTAVSWIGVRCNTCGIASVSIDGGAPATVDTAGPSPGSLASEAVFYASGLATGAGHTMVITVTGTTNSGGTNIAVDAIDVMP
jgi:hypothetical protein